MTRRPKIVVLGMLSRIPVAGAVWQNLHYLIGLQRLGCDVYYVEAHGRTPTPLMVSDGDNSSLLAAGFLARTLARFDLGDRWAFHALHEDGACYGMSARALKRLYRQADVILNLHGGTLPREEHAATGRLVYVETDPVQLQVELHENHDESLSFLEQHCAFFTFGENYGRPGCLVPTTPRFPFKPTRQPVVLDWWPDAGPIPRSRFTTIGNWRQEWRDVWLDGERYTWTKDREFERFLDLPSRAAPAEFELALSSFGEVDRRRLEAHGWRVRRALPFSLDLDAYRTYISRSRGEFSAAKEQNVRLRSGWFSDRSASYLAAGRPVVVQDTGFGAAVETGPGLHAVSTVEEAAAAIAEIESDYEAARAHARAVAREYFDAARVLRGLLDDLGVAVPHGNGRAAAIPQHLPLTPLSRRPLKLSAEVVDHCWRSPAPYEDRERDAAPEASIVMVVHNAFTTTRLAIEAVIANTDGSYELIVVDNASTDATPWYLGVVARRFAHVRVIRNAENLGFPAACNQGLELARGNALVLLNSDTIAASGWLAALEEQLRDPSVGLVAPTTNRIGNECEVLTSYSTFGEMDRYAAHRRRAHATDVIDLTVAPMFCVALRRDVFERVGPLDERFGVGLLEDDDYSERVREAGLRIVCAGRAFVHHFGEASFGDLYASGAHSKLLAANRALFREKWGREWRPYERRQHEEYDELKENIRAAVARLPTGTTVLVASRGDDEMVRFDDARGWHFPQTPDGVWAGAYPADDGAALSHLSELTRRGARYLLFPRTAIWWLQRYPDFARHLEKTGGRVYSDGACTIYELPRGVEIGAGADSFVATGTGARTG